jgi:hypothetical protein
MATNGEVNTKSGIYRKLCCGQETCEITLDEHLSADQNAATRIEGSALR